MKIELKAERLFLTSISEIEKVSKKSQEKIVKLMSKESQHIVGMIKKLIGTPRSEGRTYWARSKEKKIHIASKPGYSPNPDTFNLRNGIEFVKETRGFKIKAEAFSKKNFDYAPVMEFGTKNKKKGKGKKVILARPYFYTTIQKRLKSTGFRQRQLTVFSRIKNELEAMTTEKITK